MTGENQNGIFSLGFAPFLAEWVQELEDNVTEALQPAGADISLLGVSVFVYMICPGATASSPATVLPPADLLQGSYSAVLLPASDGLPTDAVLEVGGAAWPEGVAALLQGLAGQPVARLGGVTCYLGPPRIQPTLNITALNFTGNLSALVCGDGGAQPGAVACAGKLPRPLVPTPSPPSTGRKGHPWWFWLLIALAALLGSLCCCCLAFLLCGLPSRRQKNRAHAYVVRTGVENRVRAGLRLQKLKL